MKGNESTDQKKTYPKNILVRHANLKD